MRRIRVAAVFVTLGVAGAVATAALPTPNVNEAVAAQARPNVVVIETDDQTRRVDAGDEQRQLADRRPGGDVQEQLRQLLALLPVARHLPHRPVRAQPRRARQPAAERRLRPLPGPARKQQPRRLAAATPATTPP